MIPFYEHAQFVGRRLEGLWLRRIYVPERPHSLYRHEFLFDFEEAFWLLHLEPGMVLHTLLSKRLTLAKAGKLPPFLQRFLSVSRGRKLQSFQVLPDDRVLRLSFGEEELIVECFPSKPNMHHFQKGSHLGSYRGKSSFPANYEPPARGQGKRQEKAGGGSWSESSAEEKILDILQQKGKEQLNSKRLQDWQQQRKRAERELQKTYPPFKPYREAAIFLKSGTGPVLTPISINDEKLPLSPQQMRLPRAQLADHLFQLARKQDEKRALMEVRRKTLQAFLALGEPPLPEEAEKGKVKEKPLGWKGPAYLSQSGVWILAGRDADENRLLLKLLNGNDWWLHIRRKASSHVGLVTRGSELMQEDLLDAAQVLLMTSLGKSWGKVEVLYTRRKHVKNIKKSSLVTYTQEKTLMVSHEPNRWKAIKERQPQAS